jgi:predicted dehydrogenase
MGFNLRHHGVCLKIRELIGEGAIGRLISIDERAYYWGGRTYMSRWNRFYEMSGGLFVHKGSHDFDLMNWYNPGGLPAAVSAFAGVEALREDRLPFELEPGEAIGPTCGACAVAYKCRDRVEQDETAAALFGGAAGEAEAYDRDTCLFLSEKDTHDNGVAIVEYDNGVRCSYWEVFFTPVSTRRFTIIGDRGHLDADLTERRITLHPRWTKDRVDYTVAPAEGLHGGADPAMVETFLRNLREGRTPAATLYDGTISVAVGEAAERARREGRVVRVEELVTAAELAELFPERRG